MAEQMKRQTAYKIQVSNILSSKFVKEEGWNPNYIIDKYGRKVSRINIFCTIIDIPETHDNMLVDDGTGQIQLRAFNDPEKFRKFGLGDIVLIIGRIREYNSERYLSPEIIKRLDNPKWLELRKKELEMIQRLTPVLETTEDQKKEEDKELDVENILVEEENISPINDPTEKILGIIREIDQGEGADIDQVISKSEIENCEKKINSLLMEGDIFEIKPGKLKVLE